MLARCKKKLAIKILKQHLARWFATEMPATGADRNRLLQPDGLEETRPPRESEEMAFFLFRGIYSTDGYRGLVNSPTDRDQAARDIHDQCGVRTVAYFYSPSEAGFVQIIECSPEQLTTLEMVGMATGGFAKMTAELLVTNDQFQSGMQAASKYRLAAPNEDEIDRLLLDD